MHSHSTIVPLKVVCEHLHGPFRLPADIEVSGPLRTSGYRPDGALKMRLVIVIGSSDLENIIDIGNVAEYRNNSETLSR
jgi:hypothetical protein